MNKSRQTLTSLLLGTTLLTTPITALGEEKQKSPEQEQKKVFKYTQQVQNQFEYLLNKGDELLKITSSMPKGTNLQTETFYCLQLNQVQSSLYNFHNIFNSRISSLSQSQKTKDLVKKIQNIDQRLNLAYQDKDEVAIENLDKQFKELSTQKLFPSANTLYTFLGNRAQSANILNNLGQFPLECKKVLEKLVDDQKMENFIQPKKKN